MSYILDSLKKSDQKREQGKVPDLHTSHVARAPARRYFWPWFLLVALLMNAGLLVWWFGPWSGDPVKAVAGKPSAVVAEAPVGKPAVSGPVSPTPTIVAPPPLEPVREEPEKKAVKPALVAPGPEPTLSPGEQQPRAREPQAVVAEEKPVEKVVRVAVPPEVPVAAAPVSPRSKRLYRPSELPGDIAGRLPELTFNLHYYSRNPGSRLVRINGVNLREGGELKPGVSVDEITPHGLVLDVSGYRVWVEKP